VLTSGAAHYLPEQERPCSETIIAVARAAANARKRGSDSTPRPVDGAGRCRSAVFPIQRRSAARFAWWRSRMLGWRTNHWVAFFAQRAVRFQAPQPHCWGFDWRFYDDVAPTTQCERLIGRVRHLRGLRYAEFPEGCRCRRPRRLSARLLGASAGTRRGITIIPPRAV